MLSITGPGQSGKTTLVKASFPGFETDIRGLEDEREADGVVRYLVDCIL
jgi:hypothetical protein